MTLSVRVFGGGCIAGISLILNRFKSLVYDDVSRMGWMFLIRSVIDLSVWVVTGGIKSFIFHNLVFSLYSITS